MWVFVVSVIQRSYDEERDLAADCLGLERGRERVRSCLSISSLTIMCLPTYVPFLDDDDGNSAPRVSVALVKKLNKKKAGRGERSTPPKEKRER